MVFNLVDSGLIFHQLVANGYVLNDELSYVKDWLESIPFSTLPVSTCLDDFFILLSLLKNELVLIVPLVHVEL